MKNFLLIDLKPYFNHRAILGKSEVLDYEDPEAYGLDHNQSLFRELPGLDTKQEVQVKNIAFRFPDQSGDNFFDNIRCSEQIIRVQERNVLKVHLLGCSVQGDHKDNMILNYSNHSSEQIQFSFMGWVRAGKDHQFVFDNEVLSGNREVVFRSLNTKNEKVGFTYCISTLNNTDNKLEYIQLPDNEFMHVFAMTLETKQR